MIRFLLLLALLLPQDRPKGAFGKGGHVPGDVTVEKGLCYTEEEHEKQKLDVYRPKACEGKTLPGIVFIHGGGWRSGSKEHFAWYCAMLAQKGYVVASINYRLAPNSKYPRQIEDCQNAIRWFRKNAEKYGLDPARIAAMGGSAGGHLASLVGMKDDEGCRVQAVVSYFGPHDLDCRGSDVDKLVQSLMGGTKEEKPEAYKDASASNHITPDDPPVLMVHGDRDRRVPLILSKIFLKNLKEGGVEAELITVRGGGHGLGEDNCEPSMEEVDKRVVAFLDKHLKKSPVSSPQSPDSDQ